MADGRQADWMYHPYGQIFFGMRLPLLFQRRASGRRSEKSANGGRGEFCSAMAATSIQTPIKSSEGYSEGRPIEGDCVRRATIPQSALFASPFGGERPLAAHLDVRADVAN